MFWPILAIYIVIGISIYVFSPIAGCESDATSDGLFIGLCCIWPFFMCVMLGIGLASLRDFIAKKVMDNKIAKEEKAKSPYAHRLKKL